MEYLSHYLRAFRAIYGRTQHYMAALIEVDQSTYSRIEKGTEKMSIEKLAIIAKEFGMEPHQFLEMAKRPPSLTNPGQL